MNKSKEDKALIVTYVPVTPGGTHCFHLKRNTRQEAIDALLIDAAHMPYGTWENFEKRGYEIHECHIVPEDKS